MSVGKIVQVMGPSVDIQFETEDLPAILNAIEIEDPNTKSKLVLEAAQHIGDNIVRCIALASTEGLVRGMKAQDTGAPIAVPGPFPRARHRQAGCGNAPARSNPTAGSR